MDNFQVFVKPVGAACNLACSYCYYLDKKKIHNDNTGLTMNDSVLEAYIIQHIKLSTEPGIFFSWHGGEPTLAGLKFFRRVIELQQKFTPPASFIVNGIQTNGTLVDHEWCRFLKQHNFIVGLSLDGPENFHSGNRLNKNRKSSFDDVIRGYQLLKQYQIPCEILCVLSAANAGYPLEIYRFFKQLNAEYITFLPLVEKHPSNRQRVSDRSVAPHAFGEFLCSVFDEWKTFDIGKIKIQVFEEALRSAFNLEHSLCIFRKTCGRVPVVERNGDFYSCDHYVNGENLLGNICITPMDQLLESPAQKAFGNSKWESLPGYCLKCEVREQCNGACPKDRFVNTPDDEPGLNYLCEGYKKFFNHVKPFVREVAQAWQS